MSLILGGLAALGSGIAQSQINAKVARENTDKTIAANREMAQYQYSKDLEMWNKGNMYNAPMAQMERLKKAGLNPNLVYGSGSAAGNSAGQLPKYNAPTASYNYQPPVDIPSMINQFQDFRIKNAQAGIAESNERVMDTTEWSRGQLVKDKQILQRIDRDVARDDDYGKRALAGYQAQYAAGRIQSQLKEQARLVQATRNLDLQNNFFAAKAITGLFGGAVGAAGKLGAMLKGTSRVGKAAGKLSGGTISAPKVRYNSPTSWRNAGF